MPTSKDDESTQDNQEQRNASPGSYKMHWVVPTVVIVLVLGIVFVIGGFVGARHNWYRHNSTVFFPGGTMHERMMGSGYGRFGGMMGNNQNRVSGVVTSVNGSSFTVAGHSSSQQVTTNSSTQWLNGNSVKVNDSVTAFGTVNNGTLTATQVVINP